MSDYVRLHVNISPGTQAALLRVARCDGVTLTVALQRLIAIGDRVHRAVGEDGERVWLSDGKCRRELQIMGVSGE